MNSRSHNIMLSSIRIYCTITSIVSSMGRAQRSDRETTSTYDYNLWINPKA